MSAPEPILSRGPISVTWFRASSISEIVIPYPDPNPPTIYPAGIAGWWRPTSDKWGQFLPDGKRTGVSMANVGLKISDEYEQITYNISPRYFENEEQP